MAKFIPRLLAPKINEAHKYFPVIVVTGPRQSGKTSLCKELFPDYIYVNLEDITTRATAAIDPAGFLDSLGDFAIIDEVQNVPDILSMIQVRVDEQPNKRYILTGSSNFSLLEKVTQSLAGRAALFTLLPFSLPELGNPLADVSVDKIMFDGLFPGVISNGIPPRMFFRNYYNTYVERDVRRLVNIKNILEFDSFMRILASCIGSEFNASAISRRVGVTSVTINEWLSILATSYIAFPLRPYFTNISKQLTKMPKIYFYDTGLVCFLLGITSPEALLASPFRGTIFENLAICELIKQEYNLAEDPHLNFFRDKNGLEVDAILAKGPNLHLYEVKAGETIKPDYRHNIDKVASILSGVSSSTVIYNGPTIGTVAVNIRDI